MRQMIMTSRAPTTTSQVQRKRVRTPNRPVTPLPEPIIDRDFLDRDYDTPYTVGQVSPQKSEPVPVSPK